MNGWTGGQYSALRALLGAALLARFAGAGAEGALAAALAAGGALASACLGLGFRARAAAIAALALAVLSGAIASRTDDVALAGLLLAQLLVPAAPYGSWDARGRADPGGAWRLPAGVPWLARSLVLIVLALWALSDRGAAGVGLALALLLACDPSWLAPVPGALVLYYDGGCGLCHRAVRFVLAEDRRGAFRFAPLASGSFARAVAEPQRSGLPDSIVLLIGSDQVLVRSNAMLEIGAGLGGLWRILALAARLVPRALRDAAYDRVAAVRQRLFARPEQECPVLPPDLRERFD